MSSTATSSPPIDRKTVEIRGWEWRMLAILCLPGIPPLALFGLAMTVVGVVAFPFAGPSLAILYGVGAIVVVGSYSVICSLIASLLWRGRGWGLICFALFYAIEFWAAGALLEQSSGPGRGNAPAVAKLATIIRYFCLAAFLYVPLRFSRWLLALAGR